MVMWIPSVTSPLIPADPSVFFEGAGLGVDRGNAESAAHAGDLSQLADVAGASHGADESVEGASDDTALLHFHGGLAHRLDHKGDGAVVHREIGDGKRDAFAVRLGHDDDELSGIGGLGE
jgi:hypothetical protein